LTPVFGQLELLPRSAADMAMTRKLQIELAPSAPWTVYLGQQTVKARWLVWANGLGGLNASA
jgi:hypothetical protein